MNLGREGKLRLSSSHTTEYATSLELDFFSPIRWTDNQFFLLDQTLLPQEETWIHCTDLEIVCDAIKRLAVRGAPAIGVAAAYGLAVAVGNSGPESFDAAYQTLMATRPTAVNLRWALDLGRDLEQEMPAKDLHAGLIAWAQKLHVEDAETNRRIGEHGKELFAQADRVLTHCNAGALATAGFGTAVGVVQAAFEAGRLGSVWVDETRPLLQGARLTTWELKRLGIPHQLVTDSSVGALMSRSLVDRCVVGSDRIAANGDVANKIGTYTAAVMAHRHGVPFYVAAPLSTIDRSTPTGNDIPIEERASAEVSMIAGKDMTPSGTEALNIAFDVTPAELVTAIITEQGVLRAPYEESIAAAFARAAA